VDKMIFCNDLRLCHQYKLNLTFIYVFGNYRDGLKLLNTSDLWISFIEHMHSFIMRMLRRRFWDNILSLVELFIAFLLRLSFNSKGALENWVNINGSNCTD